ncbi:hypothetical protein NT05HA_1218 [Aggregatibacter aphrophilus NJ8700]|nr:hypothetical protein NT05HA_1218 [Aggregatibacter aphrophilus NJ8700]
MRGIIAKNNGIFNRTLMDLVKSAVVLAGVLLLFEQCRMVGFKKVSASNYFNR